MATDCALSLTLQKVKVLEPTWDEFRDERKYLSSPELLEAGAECGIVKVKTPPEWMPTVTKKVLMEERMKPEGLINKLPFIRQEFKQVPKHPGIFLYLKRNDEEMPFESWKSRAAGSGKLIEEQWRNCRANKNELYLTTGDEATDEIHNRYWATLDKKVVLYAADQTISLMRSNVQSWKLDSVDFPCLITEELPRLQIPGITSSYTYFGAPSSTFPWHTEDSDLYSINYLHGQEEPAVKAWYGIAPKSGPRFEKLVASLFGDEKAKCSSFLRHKSFVIHPKLLLDNGIPVFTTTQKQGEMIITMPFAYHSGYNTGFNIAEARNALTLNGLPDALAASHCSCQYKMDPLSREQIEKITKKRDPALHKKYLSYKNLGLTFPRAGKEESVVIRPEVNYNYKRSAETMQTSEEQTPTNKHR